MRISFLSTPLVFYLACLVQANFGPYVEENPNGILLVINEFMASNNSSKADPQGQYDDWIEIYNHGSYAIDIGDMYMTPMIFPLQPNGGSLL
jgi:hypothetical protein